MSISFFFSLLFWDRYFRSGSLGWRSRREFRVVGSVRDRIEFRWEEGRLEFRMGFVDFRCGGSREDL